MPNIFEENLEVSKLLRTFAMEFTIQSQNKLIVAKKE